MIRKLTLFFLLGFIIQARLVAQVSASFTVDHQEGCPTLIVQFTDNSTGNPTSFYWDFDNGNTSTSQDATASFDTPGIYNVLHVVWTNPAFKDSVYMQIKVFQPPTDSFTSYDNIGCSNPCHMVDFINLTIPGESPIAQYVWDFGDQSNSSPDYNPSHCYTTPGTYNVTLITLDSNGCKSSIILYNFVVIKNPPIVSLSASPTQSCSVPQLVNFNGSGSSTNGYVTFEMFYGDSLHSGLPSSSHTYSTSGIYTPYLVVTDSLGCVDTAFAHLALTNVIAGFTSSTINACENGPVTFTDTSNFAATWSWSFGDGGTSTLQNPAHIYASNGNYTVSLTVTFNGCSNTVTKTSYIHVSTPINFTFGASDTTNCTAPFSVNFTNNAAGASSYNWNFGDSVTSAISNPSHTYTTPGSYTVSLTVGNSFGCLNTKTIPAYIVIGGISAGFTVDSTHGCSPFTVIFTNTSTSNVPITNYQWTFGDGGTSTQANPTYTYQTTGNYTPRLIITNADGCKDTISPDVIKVGSTLNPEFTAAPLIQCVDQVVSFTNLTQGTTNNTTYLWNFGDGQTSTLKNPTHAFSDTGEYNITLTVINQGCSKDTERIKYILIIVPKAQFGYKFTCNNPTSVTFSDSSVGAQTWFWEFGDGTTSNVQNPPTHNYAHQGSYTVTLIVTNATTGCVDSMRVVIPVGTPVASFGANITSGCGPLTVHFADSSAFANNWLWNFGDSTATSTLKNPTHQYTKTGSYTVTLIIGSGTGCVDTFKKVNYITVYGIKIHISDGPYKGCTPYTANFIDSSTSYLGTDVAWKWTFGTGDTSLLKNPSYVFSSNGTYTVTLHVTDSHGCTATGTTSVTTITPIAKFISDTVICPGEVAHFTNQSQNANAYLWIFGDGATSNLTNPTHKYTTSGDYTIQLVAINNPYGCRDTISVANHVNVDTPQVDFYTTSQFSPCPPFPASFVNTTTRPGLTWLWYFGDGDTSTQQNPIHVYFFPGKYNVTLIGTDSSGCSGSKEYIDLIIIDGPIGLFTATPDTGCVPLTVTYAGTTQSTASSIEDMGDGNAFSDSVNVIHTYTQPGTYYPIFTLTDSLGCHVHYPVDTIVVGLIPYPGLPPDTSVCKGNYVQFNLPYGDHFQWTSNMPDTDFLTCDTCQSTLSKSPDTITYYVVATTNIGCVAKDTITVNVDALPQIYPGVEYRICPSDTLQLHAGPLVTSAVWTPDIYISDTNSVNPTVWPPDTVIYRVTGSNDLGCSISKIVSVWPITKVVANLLPYDTLVCGGTPVALLINVDQASAIDTFFTWLPSTYLSANNIYDPVISPPPGDYNYTVIVGSTGCIPDTNLIHLIVVAQPDITAGTTISVGTGTTVAAGTTLQLYAASHQSPVTYTWTPAIDSLSCDVCVSPYIDVTHSQTVYVKVTDQYGCTANDSVVLDVVSCDSKMIFVPNTFTPNGDGLNDKLFVRGIGITNLNYFRIFDRWGKLVFETHDATQGWDGTLAGKPAEVATYVYELKATCTNGFETEKSGNVTLIR